MPSRWSDRWIQNEDGTYTRNVGAASADGYEDMTKAELVAEAERLGLPTSGTKAELIERLTESVEA